MSNIEHRLKQLAAQPGSAKRIFETLKREGHKVSLATVGRRLAEFRGPRPAPAVRISMPTPRRANPAPVEDVLEDYPTDDETIGAILVELVDAIDKTWAKTRAWPRCGTCGERKAPK